MIIETNSEKETYAFGLELGKKAHAGQVYTLVGDLGVGKTVLQKVWQEAWIYWSR